MIKAKPAAVPFFCTLLLESCVFSLLPTPTVSMVVKENEQEFQNGELAALLVHGYTALHLGYAPSKHN